MAEKEKSTIYYPINEDAARLANNMNSLSDYKPGSATAEYRQSVDRAAALAEKQKARVDPLYHEKIDRLVDTYARRLAENLNDSFRIESRVPSILIAGGGNFPVRKKEKQNAARDRNRKEWREIQGLLDKIRSTGMGGIRSDDPNAITKLESKLSDLVELQDTMKAVNAYYRKNKTLDGCPHISQKIVEELKSSMASGWHIEDKPYASWALSNNNAEIRRVRERIETLIRQQEAGFEGWEFPGGRVEVNTADTRLQVFFDDKPDEDVRSALKSHGFRWAPSVGAWQRQLNDNAMYAARHLECLQPLTVDQQETDSELEQDSGPSMTM